MSVNGNEEPTGEICHQYSSVVTAIIPSLHNKTPVHSTWRLLRVRAACPTPRLNQSYELRPSWEHHLRYVPHRVRNGYNSTDWWVRGGTLLAAPAQRLQKNRTPHLSAVRKRHSAASGGPAAVVGTH